RLARLEQLPHLDHGIITHQKGPGSRWCRAARGELGTRLQINDVPARFGVVECARLRGPSATGNDHRWLVTERVCHLFPLHLAKRLLALLGEDHRDRLAFLAKQNRIDVDEAGLQLLGNESPDGGFPGPRQADENEVLLHDAAPFGVRARTCWRSPSTFRVSSSSSSPPILA